MRNRAFLSIYKLEIPDTVFSLFSIPTIVGRWSGDVQVANHILILALELEINDVKKQVQICLGWPPMFCSWSVSSRTYGITWVWFYNFNRMSLTSNSLSVSSYWVLTDNLLKNFCWNQPFLVFLLYNGELLIQADRTYSCQEQRAGKFPEHLKLGEKT